MRKELVSFYFFKDYAAFLLKNHLDALVEADIARSRKVNLPLLKLFDHLSEKELLEVSRKGIEEYLQTIIAGNALEAAETGMKEWKEDRVPGIPREKVVASDIALIYNVRKHSLLQLLPLFTKDIDVAVSLIREIEDYYSFQESMAIQTYSEINQDEISRREKRLKEAQNLANLGWWEYDLEHNQVKWSEELYHVYGLNPSVEINAEVIGKHIYQEDIAPLMDKVKEIYTSGGSYTHEYRIKTVQGETRFLADKGYSEQLPDGRKIIKGISQDITERKVSEEAQLKLKSLTDASLDFIGLFDMNGNALYINEAGQKLVGLASPEEVRKTQVTDYFAEDSKPLVSGSIIPEVRSKGHWEGEMQFRHFHTGELIDVTWSVFMVKNTSGMPVGLGCVSQDIRPRKKYEALILNKHKQLEEAQQIAHLGSWEWDTVNNRVSWSDEMYRLFGYEPGETEMDYERYTGHIHPADRDSVSATVQKCYTHQIPYSFEHRIIRKDGSIRWMYGEGKVTQAAGKKTLKLGGIAMDITADKKKEEALKQRTQALEASNKELEAFCYTISHDLRSPLRAIDGFGRRLAQQYAAKLDLEGQRLLNVVRTNAQQMGVLIDSLLDFSRLNRRELNKSELEMTALVGKVIEEYGQQYPHHRASFYVETLPPAAGDQELIRQVWHNLIANAVKFSSRSEKPRIEIGSEKKGEETVYFIKDNGVGFEMEYADKLFGVFQRLHSEEEYAGTGVGLATVQRIIFRHGGKVWGYGEPGKGAVFYLTLPEIAEVKEKNVYLEQKN